MIVPPAHYVRSSAQEFQQTTEPVHLPAVGFLYENRWAISSPLPIPAPQPSASHGVEEVERFGFLIGHLSVEVGERYPKLSKPTATGCEARGLEVVVLNYRGLGMHYRERGEGDRFGD